MPLPRINARMSRGPVPPPDPEPRPQRRVAAQVPPPNRVANGPVEAIIKFATNNHVINEEMLACFGCKLFPDQPVTGPCGHTRCSQCTRNDLKCPCGVIREEAIYVNTLVQDLNQRFLQNWTRPRFDGNPRALQGNQTDQPNTSAGPSRPSQSGSWPPRFNQYRFCHTWPIRNFDYVAGSPKPRPESIQMRFNIARRLMSTGRYFEAAPLLAHVAASEDPISKEARVVLAKVMSALIKSNLNVERLTRHLFTLITRYSTAYYLRLSDLECSLCFGPFRNPITTPCGHNYCFTCLEQSLDYWKDCPLCKYSLMEWNMSTIEETLIITEALRSLNSVPPPEFLEDDEIRLLVCTLAYPGVACPLYVMEPRCWQMVRRVLRTDRRFGMLSYTNDGRTASSIGTIMEVRDCIYFENGRSIITAIGVSRFRVVGRDTKEGCDIARFVPVEDKAAENDAENWMRVDIGAEVATKAWRWLKSLDKAVISEIEKTFGLLSNFMGPEIANWTNEDGFMWLWWLISIVPLRCEMKFMLLCSTDLMKRLWAVSYTLDAIERETQLRIRYIMTMPHVVAPENEIDWISEGRSDEYESD